jgi:hypothetical protein
VNSECESEKALSLWIADGQGRGMARVCEQPRGGVSLKAAKRPLGGRSHPYQKKSELVSSILSLSAPPHPSPPPPPSTTPLRPLHLIKTCKNSFFLFHILIINQIVYLLFSQKKTYIPVFILRCNNFIVAFILFC